MKVTAMEFYGTVGNLFKEQGEYNATRILVERLQKENLSHVELKKIANYCVRYRSKMLFENQEKIIIELLAQPNSSKEIYDIIFSKLYTLAIALRLLSVATRAYFGSSFDKYEKIIDGLNYPEVLLAVAENYKRKNKSTSDRALLIYCEITKKRFNQVWEET